MTLMQQIQFAWLDAFGRTPTILHEDPDTTDESFNAEGVLIARAGDEWFVGVEVVSWPSSRWDQPDVDICDDSMHPTFEAAVTRAVELAHRADVRQRVLSNLAEPNTPF